MKTACYTILKNEVKYIDKWMYYAQPYTYRVLLDTGSTDGSWELLEKYANKDPNLIIEQKIFDDFRFDIARIYNLNMVPRDVLWCLCPDLDEYYSINTSDEMKTIINAVPDITNIACDRLDIHAREVRLGPPKHVATNKIHLRADYSWNQPVYEHVYWIHKDRHEKELYSDDIFLIHDQDTKKSERSPLYIKLMSDEYEKNPTNTWNNWFLLYHYYKSKQLSKYIPVACDYLKYHKKKEDKNYKTVLGDLTNILLYEKITNEEKDLINISLNYASVKK